MSQPNSKIASVDELLPQYTMSQVKHHLPTLWYMCLFIKCDAQLCLMLVTPWTTAHQASMCKNKGT